jgi:hypothetical protein
VYFYQLVRPHIATRTKAGVPIESVTRALSLNNLSSSFSRSTNRMYARLSKVNPRTPREYWTKARLRLDSKVRPQSRRGHP